MTWRYLIESNFQTKFYKALKIMGGYCGRVEKKVNRPAMVKIIGMPIAEGQDWEHGVEQGPKALRAAGLARSIENLGIKTTDCGDILVATKEGYETPVDDESFYGNEDVRNSVVIGHSLGNLFDKVKELSSDGSFVLTLGGDHSLGCATILGLMHTHAPRVYNPGLGVIWVDAHADCNTPESSDSKNYHGMPAAHAMGWFTRKTPGFEWITEALKEPLLESRLVYIGLRDIDPRERDLLVNSKVHIFTMADVDRIGISGVMEEALKILSTGPLHLSFDIDSIDPSVAPGTGTLARGGLSYRESHYICESLSQTGRLVGMDMVEVNPELDAQHILVTTPNGTVKAIHGDDPNIKTDLPTVRLAVELVLSALGKSII